MNDEVFKLFDWITDCDLVKDYKIVNVNNICKIELLINIDYRWIPFNFYIDDDKCFKLRTHKDLKIDEGHYEDFFLDLYNKIKELKYGRK